jgi:hypothetical protein
MAMPPWAYNNPIETLSEPYAMTNPELPNISIWIKKNG